VHPRGFGRALYLTPVATCRLGTFVDVSPSEFDVSDVVRNKAIAAGAQHWLDNLPSLIDEIAADWDLDVGEPFTDGTEAWVALVQRADGTPAVLKLCIPRTGVHPAAHEGAVLRLAGGRGCAELLAADISRDALLMERLGPSLHDLAWPIGRRHQVLAAAAQAMWRPVDDAVIELGFMSGADKATWLVDFITAMWQRLDRPCSSAAIDHAITCAERRRAAHDPDHSMLLHGDVHEWNALVVPGTDEVKLIDPDGLIAEPEYDLGIIMREDPVDLLDGNPFERAARLADVTGYDATAIWEWGVVERVSTGLLATDIDLQPVGAQMLHAADVIAAGFV